MSRRPPLPFRSSSTDSPVSPLGAPLIHRTPAGSSLASHRRSGSNSHSSDSRRGKSSLFEGRGGTTPTNSGPTNPDDAFENAPLAEYLAADTRPTFVLANGRSGDRVQPVFVNPALQQATGLLGLIREALRKKEGDLREAGKKRKEGQEASHKKSSHETLRASKGMDSGKLDGHFHDPQYAEQNEFLAFVLPERNPTTRSTTRWKGRSWLRMVLASGWVVVHCETSGDLVFDERDEEPEQPRESDDAAEQTAVVDWTRDGVPSPSPFVHFLRSCDWSATAIGPMERWPWELRSWCNTLMADPSPGIIFWGPQHYMVYNQACMQIIGDKHPAALGEDPGLAFGELWPHVADMAHRVRATGRALEHHNLNLPMQRHGSIEETFWDFAIMPILGPDGRVAGIYDRFTETTNLNIVERRQKTLVRLGELGRVSRSLKELWQNILKAIDLNTQTPYAMIFSVTNVEESGDGSTSRSTTSSLSSQQQKICELEGTVGVPEGHAGVPLKLDLSEDDDEIVPFLRQAWRSNEPILMSKKAGTLPAAFCIRNPVRGFAAECTDVVVIPVRFALENSLVAFLVHGLNPRRPYDSDYKGYVTLMQSRISELAANIFLPEEDQRTQAVLREEMLRQASLASRLLSKTHEAEQKQTRFMRLAQNAPIGMIMYDAEGKPLFCNDAYFEMTGQSRETFTPYSWLDTIHSEDRDRVAREWRKLIEKGIPVTIEHRVNKQWRSVDPVDGREVIGETWLLSSAFPEITGAEMNGPAQIMGWVIDISHQKWAEELQRQRLEDALENKRQSENFIDMTSHEMRNPLSAILQSADGINTAIASAMADGAADTAQRENLATIGENARTIVLCAQHQKRIVDDILTLSKLDSNLLLITPDQASPVAIVRHVLKMYEAELLNSAIEVALHINPSYASLGIRHVLLDPSRLLQVLINLLTNAIKFTQFQPRRSIAIFLSASRERPQHGPNNAKFFPTNANHSKAGNLAKSVAYEEEPIYLTFAVQDSGRGLSQGEHKMLFHRFSQANPRTHVQYGGSGLGLFISRELTELQGGQIGVSSVLGQGSTFAFYIKSYKCAGGSSDTDDGEAPRLGLPFASAALRPVATLDRAASSPAAPLATSNAQASLIPGKPSPTGSDLSLHVLVVEDNVINQRVMAKQLQRSGCTVHVANHGGEALEFLWTSKLVVLERSDSGYQVPAEALAAEAESAAADSPPSSSGTTTALSSGTPLADALPLPTSAVGPPVPVGPITPPASTDAGPSPEKHALDVILMDLEMPVMDGLTCVREIRSLQRRRALGRHVPIICITANAREAQIEEAMAVGCDLVVTKPFRIPELLPQMQRLVDEWRAKG